MADAEQRKVELNREMPKTIREVSVSVGLTHFHPHPNDEKKDFIQVTPKDVSEPYIWNQMTDVNEIKELVHATGSNSSVFTN